MFFDIQRKVEILLYIPIKVVKIRFGLLQDGLPLPFIKTAKKCWSKMVLFNQFLIIFFNKTRYLIAI